MTFRRSYFLLFLALFATEVVIALYVHDAIVRPFIGDLLVVILIYAFARAFVKIGVKAAAFSTLLFALLVEFLQFLQIVDRLNLRDNKLARIVIGTSFSWADIAMYACGILIVLLAETAFGSNPHATDDAK